MKRNNRNCLAFVSARRGSSGVQAGWMATVAILLLLAVIPVASPAQQGSWDQVLSTLKDPHCPAEAVDRALPALQAIEASLPLDADSAGMAKGLFLEASRAYARNYHFKQALLVYKGYLGLNDTLASREKAAAVAALQQRQDSAAAGLNAAVSEKKGLLKSLRTDIEVWQRMNGRFSRNYSLVIILMTAVLAMIFIRINLQASRARNRLQENRKQMSDMQRIAVIGRFSDGAAHALRTTGQSLGQAAREATGEVASSSLPPDLAAAIRQALQEVQDAEKALAKETEA